MECKLRYFTPVTALFQCLSSRNVAMLRNRAVKRTINIKRKWNPSQFEWKNEVIAIVIVTFLLLTIVKYCLMQDNAMASDR